MPPDAGALSDTLPPPPLLSPQRASLFLDLDGVLAPIEPAPEATAPDPERTRLLKRLRKVFEGRLAVLSGRTIAEVDRICEGAAVAVAGVHGLERRRADGSIVCREVHVALAGVASPLEAFAAARPGVRIEHKRGALALHYRQAPDAAGAAEALARELAESHGLALQPGKMVFELKTPGSDKGSALADFQAEAPFAGHRPIMLGDDLTDEHAFRAAIRGGGFGVLVGPDRGTAALYRLGDVGAVFTWLQTVGEVHT